MTNIYPLIICGGNGTRLWPVSRTQSPKQFQKVGEAESLTFFQSAVERHRGQGYQPPVVVSAIRHRETIASQLAEINCTADVIHEPMGRNTGPAVLAAAFHLIARNPDALMVVIPADHVIEGDLNSTIMAMRLPAMAGQIITFGIKPRYAETGFGYITDGGPFIEFPGLRKVDRFVEKPPSRKARLLVESNVAYWASGISMFAARTIIEEYRKFDKPTADLVEQAVIHGTMASDGFELNPEFFGQTVAGPTESVVFERTSRISMAPLDVNWSDVGSWTAMYGISKSNDQGNVLQGDVIAVETTNSMVRSTSRLVTVVGLKDVIVIDTPDALLVTRVGHCQSVKKVAEYLKAGKRVEAEKHLAAAPAASVPLKKPSDELFRSAGFEIKTARISAGTSLDLALGQHREVLIASGEVIMSTALSFSLLHTGQRIDVDPDTAATLYNASQSEAEVVLLIQNQTEVSKKPEPETAQVVALYA